MIISTTILIGAGIIGGIYVLFLISFCFWFVYLLQLVLQKRNSYKASVKSCINSQNISYQIQTEFVKNVFLFVMNIVELITITIATLPTTIRSIFLPSNNNSSSIINETISYKFKVLFLQSSKGLVNNINDRILLYTDTLGTSLFALSLSLLTSLCIYLSARYAQKSWIKSANIRYYLGITVVSLVINQVCSLICIFTVITKVIHCVFELILFVLMIKHSRRLKMVVNWAIVDLNISKTNKRLCMRLKRMQIKFVKFVHLLWIGIFLILLSEVLNSVLFAVLTYWNIIDECRRELNTCVIQDNKITAYITVPISFVIGSTFTIGITFILLPYIAIGLYTMVIMLWRCVNGKTGYKTRFKNPLLK